MISEEALNSSIENKFEFTNICFDKYSILLSIKESRMIEKIGKIQHFTDSTEEKDVD